MKIGIASDHRGYELKQKIIKDMKGIEFVDFGTNSDKSVDYPDYAFKLCTGIINKKVDLGIAICGSGIGISIACNKVKGIRCARVTTIKDVKVTKKDNNANVIAFSSDVNYDKVKRMIEEFINIYAVSDSVFELSPQIIEYILSIVKSKTKNTLLQKAILYPIIYSVFASNRNDFEQKSSGKIFQDALNYISENYSSEITLNTAAKAIGCSYSYLSRVFAQSTNISFTEYLNRYRILKSITPLKGSDVTVTEIAFECGFSTLRSYNREFKKYLKVTPKEYRRNGFDYFVVESEL